MPGDNSDSDDEDEPENFVPQVLDEMPEVKEEGPVHVKVTEQGVEGLKVVFFFDVSDHSSRIDWKKKEMEVAKGRHVESLAKEKEKLKEVS